MRGEPTRAEVTAAYERLVDAEVERIGGFALRTLAEMARGSPDHEPTRYSPAEVRLAWHLIVLESERVEAQRAVLRERAGVST